MRNFPQPTRPVSSNLRWLVREKSSPTPSPSSIRPTRRCTRPTRRRQGAAGRQRMGRGRWRQGCWSAWRRWGCARRRRWRSWTRRVGVARWEGTQLDLGMIEIWTQEKWEELVVELCQRLTSEEGEEEKVILRDWLEIWIQLIGNLNSTHWKLKFNLQEKEKMIGEVRERQTLLHFGASLGLCRLVCSNYFSNRSNQIPRYQSTDQYLHSFSWHPIRCARYFTGLPSIPAAALARRGTPWLGTRTAARHW